MVLHRCEECAYATGKKCNFRRHKEAHRRGTIRLRSSVSFSENSPCRVASPYDEHSYDKSNATVELDPATRWNSSAPNCEPGLTQVPEQSLLGINRGGQGLVDGCTSEPEESQVTVNAVSHISAELPSPDSSSRGARTENLTALKPIHVVVGAEVLDELLSRIAALERWKSESIQGQQAQLQALKTQKALEHAAIALRYACTG